MGVIVPAVVAIGAGYYCLMILSSPETSDTVSLCRQVYFWRSDYPLYLAIPAALRLFTSITVGIKLYAIILTAAYIVGMYLLARTLHFSDRQVDITLMLSSIPLIPPYHNYFIISINYTYVFTTLHVSMLLPLYLALYLYAIEKGRGPFPVVSLLFVTALLPLLHGQMAQAVVIILVLARIIYREHPAITSAALCILLLSTVFWVAFHTGWATLPGDYIAGNIVAVTNGTGFIETLSADTIKGHILDIILLAVAIPAMATALIRNHHQRGFRLIAFSMIVFALIYGLYIFRITESGWWTTMRMLPFIFPLAIAVIARRF